MVKKRSIFSAEGYRRLANNPFVDRKMLQFIRDKANSASDAQSSPQSGIAKAAGPRSPQKPVISDEAAKLIAAALRAMLRE